MEYNHYKFNAMITIKNSVLKYCLLFVLTISSFCVFGQSKSVFNSVQPYKIISFGEKVAFENVENTARWTVSNVKENIFSTLTGNQINEFVFEKEGDYEISYSDNRIHNENECNHSYFADKMLIRVSPVKMTFDFSKIVFSEKIRKGSNCDHIFITVPVNVSIKDNQSAKFTIPNVMVAGVGSEIIAKPVTPEVMLKNGTQILKYQLIGIANKEAYLMFDFIDINTTVQTYYQPEIVN